MEQADAERIFGANLRDLRKQRGWTQQELVGRLVVEGYSLHQSAIARLEMGRRPVRLNEAIVLARVLQVDLQTLLVRTVRAEEDEVARIESEIRLLESSRDEAAVKVQQAREAEVRLRHEIESLAETVAAATRQHQDAMRYLGMHEERLYDIEMRLTEARAERMDLEERPSRVEKVLQMLEDDDRHPAGGSIGEDHAESVGDSRTQPDT